MERENYEGKSMQVQNCRREKGRLNFSNLGVGTVELGVVEVKKILEKE